MATLWTEDAPSAMNAHRSIPLSHALYIAFFFVLRIGIPQGWPLVSRAASIMYAWSLYAAAPTRRASVVLEMGTQCDWVLHSAVLLNDSMAWEVLATLGSIATPMLWALLHLDVMSILLSTFVALCHSGVVVFTALDQPLLCGTMALLAGAVHFWLCWDASPQ